VCRKVLPGLLLAVLVAVVARVITWVLPAVVSEILVAILLGLVVSNAWKVPPGAGPGLRFVVQKVLRPASCFSARGSTWPTSPGSAVAPSGSSCSA
jgi:uncharacterized membrane protein YadS